MSRTMLSTVSSFSDLSWIYNSLCESGLKHYELQPVGGVEASPIRECCRRARGGPRVRFDQREANARVWRIAEGKPRVAVLPLLVGLVRERPLVAFLVVLQLFGTSQSATAAVTFFQVSRGEYIRSLPNASTLEFRTLAISGAMAIVASLWLAGAVGLWNGRSWAWWLALVLNGLAASVTIVLQLLALHSYLLDAGAIVAVVLLVLPTVRNGTSESEEKRKTHNSC